jgi:hypothetical protein
MTMTYQASDRENPPADAFRSDRPIPSVADLLRRQGSAPIMRQIAVLGVPVRFETNDLALASMAEAVFPTAEEPPLGKARDPQPMRLAMYLGEPAAAVPSMSRHLGETNDGQRHMAVSHVQHGKLFISCGASYGIADRAAGLAAAFITPEMAADTLRAQAYFVECLGLFIACRERPVTLHAAGVVHNGRCVLLTGRHGSGKSTLAYACVRAGFGLLTEDIVFAGGSKDVGHGSGRFWGMSSHLHLLPDAVRFFPELADVETVLQLNGERKIRVNVESMRAGAAVNSSTVCGVLSLSRSDSDGSRILPADKSVVKDALTRFDGDPPLDHAEMDLAADQLLAGRMAHLDVGRDPLHAVDVLRNWMETG